MSTNLIKELFLTFLLGLWYFHSSGQVATKIDLTEDQELLGLGEQHIIHSTILQEDRPIIISLPIGYQDTQANYPVLYLLDGLANIKHTVGTVELLTESGLIPPLIIVGIESLDRNRDLTPSRAGKDVYGGSGNADIPHSGGGPQFLQFLSEELIPFVESNFRTHPYRILEGHSLGGLFGVYTLMESPDLFDALIVEAPALWWNQEEMTAKAYSFFSSNKDLNKTVYFGIGGGDGRGMRQELKRYVAIVEQHAPIHFKWLHEEVGDEGHMASRLLLNYHGLRFLFSDLTIKEGLMEHFREEEFLKAEQQLKSKYGDLARRSSEDYMNLVFQLVEKENDSGAITVLERASEAYPAYIGLLTYLAKLYEKTGQQEKALVTFLQAVEVSKKYKQGQEDDLMIEVARLRNAKN